MALTDARRPTKQSIAWTAWPWSRGTNASSTVTHELAATSSTTSSSIAISTTTASTSFSTPGSVSSSVFSSTDYVPTSSTSSTSSSLTGPARFSTTTPPSTRPGASFFASGRTSTPVTLVDQVSLASAANDDALDVSDRLSTLTTPSSTPGETANGTGTLHNLTQSLLSNYSAVAADLGGDVSNGSTAVSSTLLPRRSTISVGGAGVSGGGLSLSLPDLLEEDELMALWNCTNCFLLNYGAAGGSGAANNTTKYYYANGTADPRDVLLLPTDDEDALASETTIYLIRVIATAIVLGIVILATVIGNVFVIAAILLERNLQSVANHLILSLAVADLLVACLVMPLGAVYEVSKEWRLGADLCDMWTSSDVLCCTASILHLVAIALDR
uniref:G-protein coupled receptors family 1 profile domain-containing protein n=1 Tax=Anopheles atroparvus TaxID=41427 RepID=A0A182IM29_ANOAO